MQIQMHVVRVYAHAPGRHIKEERLANGAILSRAVKHDDVTCCLRESSEE